MARGRYGTPMIVLRLPPRPEDLRRKGTCPKCMAMQGEQCRDRPGTPPPNGVHGQRLRANDVDPAKLPPYRGRRRRGRAPRKSAG